MVKIANQAGITELELLVEISSSINMVCIEVIANVNNVIINQTTIGGITITVVIIVLKLRTHQ